MAVPTERDSDVTVRIATDGKPSVRDGIASERVVSVLFCTGIEEWRRGWNRRASGAPTREAIVSAGDNTRGTGVTTQVVPDRQLAYTVLGASADTERVLDAVSEYLGGGGSAPSVVIDDVGPLLSDRGISSVEALVEGIGARLAESVGRVVIGCSFGSETAAGVVSTFDPTVDIGRIEHPVVEVIEQLRRDDPTTFGYLRRHWSEARDGIEACDRNYPQSKQVHAVLSDPETSPRTLGAALSGLVTVGVLDTWGETVGSTRYDLTAYDPGRMWAVGAAFESGSIGDGDEPLGV
ncbi:hypothetical protein [Halorubrum trueperi]|uniref:Uncharacterized protein n=1 Tax=Halorubrum trueperi TaxID=2004704 RepID=A0ABD5UJW5_9EURY